MMEKLVIKVPISESQREHTIDHLAYGTELGILQSEYGWIRQQLQKYFSNQPGKLFKIEHANLDIMNGVWDVDCTVNSLEK